MSSQDPLHDPASALVEAAQAFHQAAETPGSHRRAPESLELLQEALQELSAAWYRLAADAAPPRAARDSAQEEDSRGPSRVGTLSREEEVTLIGALHDVAAAFARCARGCREGESVVGRILARRAALDAFGEARQGDGPSRFSSRRTTAGALR
jgi:hypothetical protein